jgi:uncharacterized protein YprB with RNaseH-like and TPR domain/predicted nuclease with RNAse H fold/adenylate kinase family enzyme
MHAARMLGAQLIESTFLHLPRVGPVLERRLWASGFVDWDKLWRALTSGVSARECVRERQQRTLFDEPLGLRDRDFDPLTTAWIDCIDQSRAALETNNHKFFLERLRPSAHWRLLPAVMDDALFLDIETTGLSREHHYVTVIGALFHGQFHQWAWPQSPKSLADLVEQAAVVITFNGARFDLPFLSRQIPSLPRAKAHIDLRHVAHAAGIKGGQKEIECAFQMARTATIEDFDGEQAVFSWCASLYGNESEYRRLLRYNRADVEALPHLSVNLYNSLCREATAPAQQLKPARSRNRIGHPPINHSVLTAEWRQRMPSYQQLHKLLSKNGAQRSIVVGIDLRSNPTRPTGWAVSRDIHVETAVLFSDEEILARTLIERPDIVSIDAPLSLPRGRQSVSDDSPCRKLGGIVRDAERILWSRHIRVYPALIRQMQGLTARGIALTRALECQGIRVIESYPGAAQDVLNIPRKKDDQRLLEEGLRQFGYQFPASLSHDELDAITSALVGHFYLAGLYEAIGADDEGYMINPRFSNVRWNDSDPIRTRGVFLTGLPGAGKTTIAKQLSMRLGWNCLHLGEELRKCGEQDPGLGTALNQGSLAPEPLVLKLVGDVLDCHRPQQVIVDGFPRHSAQLELLNSAEADWQIIWLDVAHDVAIKRLQARRQCSACGHVGNESRPTHCPVCGSREWNYRSDDLPRVSETRMQQATSQLHGLSENLPSTRITRIRSDQPVRSVCADVLNAIEAFRPH